MEEKEEMFTCDGGYINCISYATEDVILSSNENKQDENTYRAVAIIGDAFYHDCYLPAKELEKSYSGWNNTLQDINHMGTSHLMGLGAVSDIRFFVGYQDNVTYNPETKSVTMDIHVDEQTLYGKAWKAYVNLCKQAGKIPNVSVTFLAKRGVAKAKDIIADYTEFGYKGDESITYLRDIRPIAVSTVLKGACSDEKGCGIGMCSVKHSDESVIQPEEKQEDTAREEERKKLIAELEKLDKE